MCIRDRFKVDRGCRIERSYADFQKYLGANPETTIVQMYSVIGRLGGKCLLTIHFVESSLMLSFLRDANTSASVIEIINLLDEVLGAKTFNSLFPVILTDNGSAVSYTHLRNCHSDLKTESFADAVCNLV